MGIEENNIGNQGDLKKPSTDVWKRRMFALGIIAAVTAAAGLAVTMYNSMSDSESAPPINQISIEMPDGVEFVGPELTHTAVSDDLSIETSVGLRPLDTVTWFPDLTVRPGAIIEVLMTAANRGPGLMEDLVFGVSLPDSVQLVSSSTAIFNSHFPPPGGYESDSDNIATGGIEIGNYAPGANAGVRFAGTISTDGWSCGSETVVIGGYAKPADATTARSEALLTVQTDC